MKQLYPILFFILLSPVSIFSQVDSASANPDIIPSRIEQPKPDTLKPKPRIARIADSTTSIDANGLQINDSLFITDSLRQMDSLHALFIADSLKIATAAAIKAQQGQLKDGEQKPFIGKESLFYYIMFLLILFGLLRRAFEKYFHDLFRVFFKTTLKQRQTQEQLLQSPLPSIFMNSFFVLSAGLYVNFLFLHFRLTIVDDFWLQYLYCAGGLASIYLLKYIGLKIAGWMFNVSNATDSYIFIVFIINKMLGIFLLPFLLLIAFTNEPVYGAAFVFSWFGIGILLVYRLVLSYGAVRKEIKLNSFHFILYIAGFEVIPLLLIYKLLLLIF